MMDGVTADDSVISLETTQEISDSSLNLSTSTFSDSVDADVSADPDSVSRELTDVATLLNRHDLHLQSLATETETDDSVVSSPDSVRLAAAKCAEVKVNSDNAQQHQQQQEEECNTLSENNVSDEISTSTTISSIKPNSQGLNSDLNGSVVTSNGVNDAVFAVNGVDSEQHQIPPGLDSAAPLRSSTHISLDGYTADMSASVITDTDASAVADSDADADVSREHTAPVAEQPQAAADTSFLDHKESTNTDRSESCSTVESIVPAPVTPVESTPVVKCEDPCELIGAGTGTGPSDSVLDDSAVAATLQQARDNVAAQRELELSTEDPRTNPDGWLDVVGNGQLKKKVLTAGVGERDDRPKRGQVVTLRVLERRLAGDSDTSGSVVGRDVTLMFGVGDGEVIAGLDLVVGLMQRNERAEVRMASKFGYGSKGLPDEGIPPDSDLVYIVELESIGPEPRTEELSCQQRLNIGNSKRECGNWWFKREDYSHAIQCYRRALDFLDSDSDDITGLPDDVHVLLEERLKVHNNMAAAQLKLLAYDAALRSIQLVLNCQPNNVKALFRKSKIYSAQKKWAEAEVELKTAIDAEPNNTDVRRELIRVSSVRKREVDAERDLYRRMWGNTPDKRTVAKTRSGLVASVMMGSVAIGVIAALLYRFKMF